MNRSRLFLVSACSVAFAGCSHAETSDPEPDRPVPLLPAEAAHHARRVQTRDVVAIRQTSVLPGSTGVGVSPSIGFHAYYVTKGSRFEVKKLDQIRSSSRFLDETGVFTPALTDEPDNVRGPLAGHDFVIKPAHPLLPDRTYWLLISEGPSLRVLDDRRPESRPEEAGEDVKTPGERRPWATHFFTGSSPHVIQLKSALGPNPTLRIGWSEAVSLVGVPMTTLLTHNGESVVRAARPGRPMTPSTLELELTVDAESLTLAPLVLRDPVAILGALRTATLVSKGPRPTRSPALPRRIDPGEWHLCEEGHAWCWDEPSLAPSPPG